MVRFAHKLRCCGASLNHHLKLSFFLGLHGFDSGRFFFFAGCKISGNFRISLLNRSEGCMESVFMKIISRCMNAKTSMSEFDHRGSTTSMKCWKDKHKHTWRSSQIERQTKSRRKRRSWSESLLEETKQNTTHSLTCKLSINFFSSWGLRTHPGCICA